MTYLTTFLLAGLLGYRFGGIDGLCLAAVGAWGVLGVLEVWVTLRLQADRDDQRDITRRFHHENAEMIEQAIKGLRREIAGLATPPGVIPGSSLDARAAIREQAQIMGLNPNNY